MDSVKPTTLKELKSGFEGRFTGLRSRDTVLEKWNSLRYEGETDICDFLADLKRLADILEYEGRMVKEKFLMCLPANVRVEAAREQELEKCATAAHNYIDITGVTNKMNEIAFSSQQVSFKDKRRNQTPYRDNSRSRSRSKSRSYRRERRYNQSRSRSGSQKYEDQRGKSGERDKTSGSHSQSSSKDKTMKYAYCSKSGHGWKSCFQIENEMKDKIKDLK